MSNRFSLALLTLSFLLCNQSFAKAPWKMRTTAVPGKIINNAVGPYSCRISLGGHIRGDQLPGSVDSVSVRVRSPRGVQGSVNFSKDDLASGVAQTVNLKGRGGQGRTLSVFLPKLKHQFATIEVLVDDRPEQIVDGRRMITTCMVGSRYLKGKCQFGPFAVSLGLSGSRYRDRKGKLGGKIDSFYITFKSKKYNNSFSFPKSLIFAGAVQTYELKTSKGRYSAEVEILHKGPGLLTVSIELNEA